MVSVCSILSNMLIKNESGYRRVRTTSNVYKATTYQVYKHTNFVYKHS